MSLGRMQSEQKLFQQTDTTHNLFPQSEQNNISSIPRKDND